MQFVSRLFISNYSSFENVKFSKCEIEAPSVRKSSSYNSTLLVAVKEVAQTTMTNALHDAVLQNDNKADELPIAVDGSWQKRGHASLNGVTTATSVHNNKVIDVEVG
jgi:hypothetical protein